MFAASRGFLEREIRRRTGFCTNVSAAPGSRRWNDRSLNALIPSPQVLKLNEFGASVPFCLNRGL
jgi:hypothetical protein